MAYASAGTTLLRLALIQASALLLLLLLRPLTATAVPSLASSLISLAAAAALAGLLSRLCRLPGWWVWINAGFLPLLLLAAALQLSPWWYAGAFVFSFLLFGATHRSQVPLWLSGQSARRALIAQLPNTPFRFVDVGGGLGGVVAAVAKARPQAQVCGVEWAWLPFLCGWLRLRLSGYRGEWRRGNLWKLDLGEFDLVYAYLSPAPMAQLWAKVEQDMAPDSMLISYRFAVPAVACQRQLLLDQAGSDLLLCYRVEAGPKKAGEDDPGDMKS